MKVIEIISQIPRDNIERTDSFFRALKEVMPHLTDKTIADIANIVISQTKPADIEEFLSAQKEHTQFRDYFAQVGKQK